jgi:hypothetical protein
MSINLDLIHRTHSLSEHMWHIAHNSHHVNTSHHFTKFDNMNWIPIPLIPHVHKTMIVIIIIITQVFSSRGSLINPCSHLHKHGGNKVDTQTLISNPPQMNCHSFWNCHYTPCHVFSYLFSISKESSKWEFFFFVLLSTHIGDMVFKILFIANLSWKN